MEENMISRKRKRKKGKKIVLILAAALIAGLSGFAFYKRNQAKDAAASVNGHSRQNGYFIGAYRVQFSVAQGHL